MFREQFLHDPRFALRRARAAAGRMYQYRLLAMEAVAVRRAQQGHLPGAAEARHGAYYIRRRVHMVEKGLSMTPRRDTFATSYIGDLVGRVVCAQQARQLSIEEERWVEDVLSEYFSATRASDSREIAAARWTFEGGWEFASVVGDGRAAPTAVSASPSPVTPAALLDLARSRKSIRWFDETPVPRAMIDDAVSAAQTAPTACNRQPYRFLVLDNREEAQQVAGTAGGSAGYVHNIPALAVVIGDLSAFSHVRDRHVIYIDASLASMLFILELQSHGLASCCINWPDAPARDRQIRSLIELDDNEKVVMLIALGWPKAGGLAPHSQRVGLESARQYASLRARGA